MDPAGPTAPIVVPEICGNDIYTQELHRDPRRNPALLTNKTAYEMFHLISDLRVSIPQQLDIPFFAIHGELDSIALKSGAEFVFKNAKTDLTKRKLFIAQGLKHEVIHESDPDGEKCRQMIVDYILEELKSPPGTFIYHEFSLFIKLLCFVYCFLVVKVSAEAVVAVDA